MLDKAKRFFAQKNYGLAFRQCQELLKENDSSDQLYFFMGMVLKAMDQTDIAENYLMISLQLRPENQLSMVALAELDFEKGNYEKSRQTFNKILKDDPYNLISLFYLGKLSEQSHRLEEAQAYYLQCLKIQPRFRKCRRALNFLEKKIKKNLYAQFQIQVLKQRVAQLQEALSQRKLEGSCVACLQRPSIFANQKCGHCCVCQICLPSIRKKCPLCKSVGAFIKIYKD